jgi:NAD(P)-dependent dehydrogenase (short-subunit alcohol dehydrogenase family)
MRAGYVYDPDNNERGMVMKKTVIISGGLGVLGQSYAKALEEDGYHTIVLDTKTSPSAGDFYGEYFSCDITNEDDVKGLEKHLEELGMTVHGLINNASAQPEGFTNELEEYSLKTYKRVLEVNLAGSFLLTKTVVPFMKKENNGVIINIGSIQGVVAPTFQIYEGMNITSPLAYAVAKAGMIHFCKWIAAKYGKWNIRCNAVSPGGLGDSQRGGSDFAKTYSQRTPLGRMAKSREVAEVVRFLMSGSAAYITGQNILVDGGWTIY